MNQEINKPTKKSMPKETIIIGVGIIVILAVILFFVFSGGKDKEDNNGVNNGTPNTEENNVVEVPKENQNPGVIEDKEQNGLTFTKTSLKTSSTNSTLITAVSNKTTNDIEVRIFEIYVKDKDGNTIVTLQGYVGGVIPAGETREIESNVDMDLSNAAELEYKLVK